MIAITCATPGAWQREARVSVWKHWHRPNETHYIRINPNDPFHYGNTLADYWKQGESFAVFEPDIVIREDVAQAFINCPEPYCAFPYEWLTNIGPALGCTRFRSELITAYPDAVKDALSKNISWNQLDVVLMRHILLRKHRQQPHVHLPPVKHLNPKKKLLPSADPTPLMQLPTW